MALRASCANELHNSPSHRVNKHFPSPLPVQGVHPAFCTTALFLLFLSVPVTPVTKSPSVSAFSRSNSLNWSICLYTGALPYSVTLLCTLHGSAMPSLAPKGRMPMDQAGCTDYSRCGCYLHLFNDLSTFTSWFPFPSVLTFLLPSDSLLSTEFVMSEICLVTSSSFLRENRSALCSRGYPPVALTNRQGSAGCRLTAVFAAAGSRWGAVGRWLCCPVRF